MNHWIKTSCKNLINLNNLDSIFIEQEDVQWLIKARGIQLIFIIARYDTFEEAQTALENLLVFVNTST